MVRECQGRPVLQRVARIIAMNVLKPTTRIVRVLYCGRAAEGVSKTQSRYVRRASRHACMENAAESLAAEDASLVSFVPR